MVDKINILLGMDAMFAPYYGVMLTSLLKNNSEHSFDVYVLTDSSWTDRLTAKYEKMLAKCHSNLFVYKVDESMIANCPLNPESHISRPTYYRLMAPSLLPSSVSKILYLDGDMIVNGDIGALWNTDIRGYAFAGVEDWAFVREENYSRLQYDRKYGYYNAGMTLYNMDYWRENGISEKIFNYIQSNRERVKWLDQDAVNGLLHEERLPLPAKYNFQVFFFMREAWNAYSEEFRQEIEVSSAAPVIIHYNGHIKPWDYKYHGYPYLRPWMRYSRMTPWLCINKRRLSTEYLKFIVKWLFFRKRALAMRNRDLVSQAYHLA